jgi:hypothetical protein
MTQHFNLGFISDEDFLKHVSETVSHYRLKITKSDFLKNLPDPIKLMFDSYVYQQKPEQLIDAEIIRQLDKSNNNHIGYFHQNIFKYIGGGWSCPEKGYDIIHKEKQIYVEMKNKHNTMNSSSSQKTYIRMLNTTKKIPNSLCFLVEVIAKKSQNICWQTTLDGDKVKDERIRRISIDQFYNIATENPIAFKQMCEALPKALTMVLSQQKKQQMDRFDAKALLNDDGTNLLRSLFLWSFKTYEGFDEINL